MKFYPFDNVDNEKGSLLVTIVGFLVIGLVVVGYITNIGNQYQMKALLKQKQVASQTLDQQYFYLMNSRWNSTDLSVGKHSKGDFSWEVKLINSRLKSFNLEVDFKKKLKDDMKEQSKLKIVGYKYYEY